MPVQTGAAELCPPCALGPMAGCTVCSTCLEEVELQPIMVTGYGHGPDSVGWSMAKRSAGHAPMHRAACRANSALDMRQLSIALTDAREGTGEVRSILLKAGFRPRLPG
jgi:hypothetical protein